MAVVDVLDEAVPPVQQVMRGVAKRRPLDVFEGVEVAPYIGEGAQVIGPFPLRLDGLGAEPGFLEARLLGEEGVDHRHRLERDGPLLRRLREPLQVIKELPPGVGPAIAVLDPVEEGVGAPGVGLDPAVVALQHGGGVLVAAAVLEGIVVYRALIEARAEHPEVAFPLLLQDASERRLVRVDGPRVGADQPLQQEGRDRLEQIGRPHLPPAHVLPVDPGLREHERLLPVVRDPEQELVGHERGGERGRADGLLERVAFPRRVGDRPVRGLRLVVHVADDLDEPADIDAFVGDLGPDLDVPLGDRGGPERPHVHGLRRPGLVPGEVLLEPGLPAPFPCVGPGRGGVGLGLVERVGVLPPRAEPVGPLLPSGGAQPLQLRQRGLMLLLELPELRLGGVELAGHAQNEPDQLFLGHVLEFFPFHLQIIPKNLAEIKKKARFHRCFSDFSASPSQYSARGFLRMRPMAFSPIRSQVICALSISLASSAVSGQPNFAPSSLRV